MPDGGKKELVKMRHYILNEMPYWDAVTHSFLVGENDSSCFSYYLNGDKSITASTQYNNVQ